jgi:hypothetical protein
MIVEDALFYNPDTGILYWKKSFGSRAIEGAQAGYLHQSGYMRVKFEGRNYPAHRMAWLLYYGHAPVGDIDHINGVTTDNRIANLRDVTHRQNLQNRKEHRAGKHPGVQKVGVKWRAYIKINRAQTHLGYFATREEAAKAYERRAKDADAE